MAKTICLLPGDGIGPEILAQGRLVLEAVGRKFGLDFCFTEGLIGGAAIAATGKALPRESLELAQSSDAIYFGAVGDPRFDANPPDKRPERGILEIRKALGLFANLRPSLLWPELASACLLRADTAQKGIDLLIVRELTGDIYFGQPRGIAEENGLRLAFNTMRYDESEIRRIARLGFDLAQKRKRRLCSVDKSNVLECSRLWRTVVAEVARDYPDIALSNMYVDNAAMQLVRDPSQFDVLLTSNLFGDILSDEAAAITGSLGMQPSASLGATGPGLFEPIHGSAPDIAGTDKANPLGTILSGAMLLEQGLGLSEAARAVEEAVRATLAAGFRTPDILGTGGPGLLPVGCREMAAEVVKRI